MGRRATALSVVIAIIGIGALGYGIYSTYNAQVLMQSSGLVHSWYTRYNYTIDMSDTTDGPLHPLNTTFSVNNGEWVYFSFSSNARIELTGITWAALMFYVAIDGETQWTPAFVLSEMPDNASDNEWHPVTFWGIYEDIEPGSHEISILIDVAYGFADVEIGGQTDYYGMSLLVQTLKP